MTGFQDLIKLQATETAKTTTISDNSVIGIAGMLLILLILLFLVR